MGWENYRALWHDAAFRRALANNLIFAAVVVPVQTGLAMVLALLVNQKARFVRFFRAVFFAPVVMGIAVASSMRFLLFDRQNGLVNGALDLIMFGHLHAQWLQSTHTLHSACSTRCTS